MSDLSYRGFALDAETALALLQWQAEMGADEPCLDVPIDRLAEAAAARPAAPAQEPPAPVAAGEGDHVQTARRMAAAADSLQALAEAMRSFDGLEIRKGARNFCLADGNPKARVMIIGEAPGEEEDNRGRPSSGARGSFWTACSLPSAWRAIASMRKGRSISPTS